MVQSVANKLVILKTKPYTPYHISYVAKIPLLDEWCDSIFSNYDRMEKSTTFSVHLLCYIITRTLKILCPWIFPSKTPNKYGFYSHTCDYGLKTREDFDFNFPYTHVVIIKFLCIIITITGEEGTILFKTDI